MFRKLIVYIKELMETMYIKSDKEMYSAIKDTDEGTELFNESDLLF